MLHKFGHIYIMAYTTGRIVQLDMHFILFYYNCMNSSGLLLCDRATDIEYIVCLVILLILLSHAPYI